jgi:hypothetical protein
MLHSDILPQSRPEPPPRSWFIASATSKNICSGRSTGEPFGEAVEIRVVRGDRMHCALAAAFPGDPASRASSAYGANGVSHDLILRLALERPVELIVTQAGDDGQRSVQHLFRFVAGRRLGQLVGQRGYGFAFSPPNSLAIPTRTWQ